MMLLILFNFLVILISGTDVSNGAVRNVRTRLPHSYEASIRFVNRHFCNGAIIGPSHILTAAHCFYENGVDAKGEKFPNSAYKYMSVMVGSAGNLFENGISYKIKNVTTHEDLSYATNDFWISDIAIVTLESEISYSNLVQPIDLPDGDVSENVRAKMSIWNSPVDALETVEVYLISHGKCADRLKEKFLGEHDSKICGYTRSGRGFCLTNDGSPLVQNERVIGVASSSRGCKNGQPDVYTNVYKSLEFIKKAILINEPQT